MRQNKIDDKYISLGELTSNLKSEDVKYATLSKRFQFVYWVLIPVYSIIVAVHILDNSHVNYIIGSVCFLVAMFIFAFLFRNYYKEYNNVDYSEPTLIMLKKAAYRYKPFQLKTLWAFLAILLIDVGLILNSSIKYDILKVQIYFLGLLTIAMAIGIILWYIRYKPIRDKALHLIKDLNNEI